MCNVLLAFFFSIFFINLIFTIIAKHINKAHAITRLTVVCSFTHLPLYSSGVREGKVDEQVRQRRVEEELAIISEKNFKVNLTC